MRNSESCSLIERPNVLLPQELRVGTSIRLESVTYFYPPTRCNQNHFAPLLIIQPNMKTLIIEDERPAAKRLEKLLDNPPEKQDKELYTFYKRMCRERQHLFVFLFMKEVLSDNNASERAIRNISLNKKYQANLNLKML